ncbi:MAG: hypothetical protein QOE27_2204, partial [Solirubrobacteraceae bacterium]|nr:hypothetical protein [Solirubrobacteraceae bacterium]
MAPLSSLEPQHRAVISLVLTKGKTYSEIAGLLDIDLETVRDRAHQALDALGPADVSRPTPGRRAAISDYLLGQEPGRAPETLAYLEQSVAGRSWARAVAPELAALAGGPLPAVPPEPPAPAEPAASPAAAAVDPPPATELPPPAIDPAPATELPPPAADPP